MTVTYISFLCSKSKRKRKRKVNINNDLAILPSHDNRHKGRGWNHDNINGRGLVE